MANRGRDNVPPERYARWGVALGYAHLWHGGSCLHTALFASAYPYGLLNKFIPHKNMNLSNSKGTFDILAQKQRCSFAFPLKTGIRIFVPHFRSSRCFFLTMAYKGGYEPTPCMQNECLSAL